MEPRGGHIHRRHGRVNNRIRLLNHGERGLHGGFGELVRDSDRGVCSERAAERIRIDVLEIRELSENMLMGPESR